MSSPRLSANTFYEIPLVGTQTKKPSSSENGQLPGARSIGVLMFLMFILPVLMTFDLGIIPGHAYSSSFRKHFPKFPVSAPERKPVIVP